MSKQGGKFGRRQVLQLENEGKSKSGYGFGYTPAEPTVSGSSGALSGLVSQYGQSDEEDSDEETPAQRVTRASAPPTKGSVVPMQAFVAASEPDPVNKIPVPGGESRVNGDSKQPKSILKKKEVPKSILKPAKKEETKATETVEPPSEHVEKSVVQKKAGNDDVDEKLKDFLAEIDALDHAPMDSDQLEAEDPDIDGEPMTPPTLEAFESREESESEAEEPDDPEPTKPKQPSTSWEHCLDEETKYYYYWNIQTNEVTWQIPEEFSQYLLKVKEYEVQQNKYEAAKREWEECQKNRPPKVKKKKKAPPLVVNTPPPPPPKEETIKKDEKHKEHAPISTATAPIFCPPEPKAPPPPPENENKKTSSSKDKKEGKKEHKKHKKSKDHPAETSTAAAAVIGPLPAPPPLIGPQMPGSQPKEHEGREEGEGQTDSERNGKVSHTEKHAESEKPDDQKSESPEALRPDGEVDMDDDFIHKQLEEPVFTHYEYVNKRLVAPPPPPPDGQPVVKGEGKVKTEKEEGESGFDLDIEDIDKELEMALNSKKTGNTSQLSELKAVNAQKRSHTEMDDQPTVQHLPKRPKTDPTGIHESSPVSSLGRLHKEHLKEKIDCLAEASELSHLVMDKLEFLDVHHSGLSDLQILLIQVETRIEDWKRGGLNSDYLLIRLREADSHLQKYEENAAPPGWMCQWDRHVRKYYYFHSESGASQWEYPMDYTEPVEQVEEELKQEQVEKEKEEQQLPQPPTQQMQEKMVKQEVMEIKQELEEKQPTQPSPSKNVFLDFARLAEAPPPPPGEPPPPGTGPLPENGDTGPASPFNPWGSDDRSETDMQDSSTESDSQSDSSSSSYSSDSSFSSAGSHHRRRHRKKRRRRKSKKDEGKYDPSNPSPDDKVTKDEEVEQTTISEPAILLPVHSKPVHIAAQPVIKRPTPTVSPSVEQRVEGEIKTETGLSGEPVTAELPGDLPAKHCGNVVAEETPAETVCAEVGVPPVRENTGETAVTVKAIVKEKKKKKDKSLSGGGLSMKRKGMSSMVEKWQKVQKDVEKVSKKKPKAGATATPVIEENT